MFCSGGSDWRTIKVKQIDVETGDAKDMEDHLEHVKFSSIAWTHDNKVPPPFLINALSSTNELILTCSPSGKSHVHLLSQAIIHAFAVCSEEVSPLLR